MATTWQQMRKRSASPNEILAAFNVTEPFVDVRRIAVDIGISVEFKKKLADDASGELELNEGTNFAAIRILQSDPEAQQRFTIAHQLGHLMGHHPLGESGTIHRDKTYSGNAKEQEANAYAAELLVPFSLLDKEVAYHIFNVSLLAKTFRVSEVVLSIQLIKWRFYSGN